MRALKPLLLSAAIACGVAACATTTSPTGRTQYVGAVPQAELNQLGAKAFAELKAQKQLAPANQQQYVRCVVNAIVAQLPADARNMAWESAVFVDADANAFALPGGKVGAYTGIFDVARNQDQLAGVIAHEIGHVVSRHHDERVTRQMGAQAGIGILGALVGSQYGSGAAQTTQQLGGAAVQAAFLLPNNRAQESEADIVGQRLMAEAGFNPEQAVNLWQNMIAAGGSRGPEWLSTHPEPQSRIAELRARAADLMPVYQQAQAAGRKPSCG